MLNPDEIITEVMVPKVLPNTGAAYIKFLPRTADDYATVSAAAVLTLDKTMKTIAEVRIALGSVGVTPIRATAAEAVLRGQPLKTEAFAEAGEKAKEAVDPVSDFRGSAAYKKDMAAVFRPARARKSACRYSPTSKSQGGGQGQTGKKESRKERQKTVKFTQTAEIPVAREPLWDFLMDVPKVAKSLPGVESVSKIDDTTYEGALDGPRRTDQVEPAR